MQDFTIDEGAVHDDHIAQDLTRKFLVKFTTGQEVECTVRPLYVCSMHTYTLLPPSLRVQCVICAQIRERERAIARCVYERKSVM